MYSMYYPNTTIKHSLNWLIVFETFLSGISNIKQHTSVVFSTT